MQLAPTNTIVDATNDVLQLGNGSKSRTRSPWRCQPASQPSRPPCKFRCQVCPREVHPRLSSHGALWSNFSRGHERPRPWEDARGMVATPPPLSASGCCGLLVASGWREESMDGRTRRCRQEATQSMAAVTDRIEPASRESFFMVRVKVAKERGGVSGWGGQ